jgi:hypothetical protein
MSSRNGWSWKSGRQRQCGREIRTRAQDRELWGVSYSSEDQALSSERENSTFFLPGYAIVSGLIELDAHNPLAVGPPFALPQRQTTVRNLPVYSVKRELFSFLPASQ